jgi:hypothetical protein
MPVQGDYDVEGDLYVITLGALVAQGTTLVLIEHPGVIAPSVPEAGGTPLAAQMVVNFSVRCSYWPLSEQCHSAHEQLAAAELASLYGYYHNAGFKDPALSRLSIAVPVQKSTTPVFVPVIHNTYSGIYILPYDNIICY